MEEVAESSNQPEASTSNGADIDGILANLEVPSAKSETKEVKEAPVKGEKPGKEAKNILGKDLVESPGGIEAEIAAMMAENEAKESSEVDENESEEVESPEEETVEEDLEEIVYNGKPEKLTKDQLKELAQKGKDYTQKTQALAEDRNKFLAEKKAAETELNEYYSKLEERDNQSAEKLAQIEKWDIAIDLMQEQDPDLFERVQSFYKNSSRSYDNPVVTRKFDAQQKEIQKLQEQLESRKSQEIKMNFEKDLTNTRNELGSKLESLGVFVDWEGKVKDAWINSGVDTVKSAVYALYGDQIRAASESRNKSLEAQLKAKSKNSIKGASGNRSSNTGEVNLHKEDWGKLTKMAIASLKNN